MHRMGRELKETTDAVLDCLDEYMDIHDQYDDGVDIDYLKRLKSNIQRNNFNIVIVGELKAGKSSLINTLIGEEILPAGTLQASSAIIHIIKSSEKRIDVTFAKHSGKDAEHIVSKTFDKANDINEYIRTLGSISEQHRELPANLLDQWLLQNHNQRSITREEIESCFENAGLDADEKQISHAERYVKTRNISEIPREIEIYYPLDFDYEGMTLVDSPGVNAVGGVEDITFDYINCADALIFTHSLTSPVEQRSLKQFIENNVKKRNRDLLSLVLTRKYSITSQEMKDKLSETQRIYSSFIPSDRILAVDSLAPRIVWDIKKQPPTNVQQLLNEYKLKHNENKYTSSPRTKEIVNELYSKRRCIQTLQDEMTDEDDISELGHMINKDSGFNELFRLLNDLGQRGPNERLKELMKKVIEGNNNKIDSLDSKINRIKEKAKNPREYEQKKSAFLTELNNKEADLYDYLDSEKEFKTDAARTLEKLGDDLSRQIQQATTIEEIRLAFAESQDAFQENIESFKKVMVKRINTHIAYETEKSDLFMLPRLDFEAVVEQATEKATKKIKQETESSLTSRAKKFGLGAGVGGAIGLLFGIITGGIGTLLGALAGAGTGAGVGAVLHKPEYTTTEIVDKKEQLDIIKTDGVSYINQRTRSSIRNNLNEDELIDQSDNIIEIIHNIQLRFIEMVKTRFNEHAEQIKSEIERIEKDADENDAMLQKIADFEERKQKARKIHARAQEILINI